MVSLFLASGGHMRPQPQPQPSAAAAQRGDPGERREEAKRERRRERG